MKKAVVMRHKWGFLARLDRLAGRSALVEWATARLVVPLLARLFWLKNRKKTGLRPNGKPTYMEYLKRAVESSANPREVRKWRYDIIGAHLRYMIRPDEFMMFSFRGKSHRERQTYLSNHEYYFGCAAKMTEAPFRKLRDKGVFYGLAREFFRRDVCVVNGEGDLEPFTAFARRHPRFFFKSIAAAFGEGCGIMDVPQDISVCFFQLLKKGPFLAEELIVQAPELAQWNPSSVNTVRLCSFRKDGQVIIDCPFLRTGRKGSVVDNGGAGGIFASIDPATGVVNTEGADELGNFYPAHPDSGVPYRGVQIPLWSELLDFCKTIHSSLPEEFHYVGFDFALNADRSWVLVEGNWGQFIAQQTTLRRGVRARFEELMDLESI